MWLCLQAKFPEGVPPEYLEVQPRSAYARGAARKKAAAGQKRKAGRGAEGPAALLPAQEESGSEE